MPTGLPGGGELGGRAEGRRFRLLAARVRVHLGVHDEDVDVALIRQHVVEPAVADVVRPSVAADEPHALFHEVIGECFEPARFRGFETGEPPPQGDHAVPLRGDAGLARLIRLEKSRSQAVADLQREMLDETARRGDMRIECQPEAEPELGVVLEK